jgi:glycerate kinase
MPAVISKTVLVLSEDFAEGLDAEGVGAALARGLGADAALDCDLCPVSAGASAPVQAGRLLDERDFDRRLRAARCLLIATARLEDDTLAGSIVFEAATRARQTGVPTYAVTARDRLDPFEARIVDLQLVLEAGSSRALSAAGRKLAAVI